VNRGIADEPPVLRVGIDARIISGKAGGVEGVVRGLAHGLSHLEDGRERYIFFAYEGHDEWIRPHISGPCELVLVPRKPKWRHLAREIAKRDGGDIGRRLWVSRIRRRIWSAVASKISRGVPVSDGTFEAFGVDIIHFPRQNSFVTPVPTIYHPHDLQHLHLPEFFDVGEIERRELHYRTLCDDSAMIAVASTWVRDDLVDAYKLNPAKVAVIPLAPPNALDAAPSLDDVRNVRKVYRLPEEFVFYPAATWPHKNHLRLLEAISALKDKGVVVPLVCSGMQTDYYLEIQRRLHQLKLDDEVSFLGFVSPEEVSALFAASRMVVIPTEFEASSFPMMEAFRLGVPVACSNVTSLPEQAGGAALLFDAKSLEAIAQAIERLWTDEGLRRNFIKLGRAQAGKRDWITTSKIFRAHYRRIAGQVLSGLDAKLVADSTSMQKF